MVSIGYDEKFYICQKRRASVSFRGKTKSNENNSRGIVTMRLTSFQQQTIYQNACRDFGGIALQYALL